MAIITIVGTLIICLQYASGQIIPESFISLPSVISANELHEEAEPHTAAVDTQLLQVPLPPYGRVLVYQLRPQRRRNFPVFIEDGSGQMRQTFDHSTSCHYEGDAVDGGYGEAVVAACDGRIEGFVHINRTHVACISPVGNGSSGAHHVDVYPSVIERKHWMRLEAIYNRGRESDRGVARWLMEADALAKEKLPLLRRRRRSAAENRRMAASSFKRLFRLRSPAGEVYTKKGPYLIKIFVLVENYYYRIYRSNVQSVLNSVQNIYSLVNNRYRPFDITIVISGISIWTTEYKSKDFATKIYAKSMILKNMKKYSQSIQNVVDFDCLHLLLGSDQYTGNVMGEGTSIGVAQLGSMCGKEECVFLSIAMPEARSSALMGTVVAHELAHTLSVEHDGNNRHKLPCHCPGFMCIMTGNLGLVNLDQVLLWSNCSVKEMVPFIEGPLGRCMRVNTTASRSRGDWLEVPAATELLPRCGNGLVEVGEQCDCGGRIGCPPASCCDPLTCRLKPNATCSDGKCCNLTTCRPHAAGHVCRSSSGPCQLSEHCDGTRVECPPDVHLRDGERCSQHGFCSGGRCPDSRLAACQRLWGNKAAVADAKCYMYNMPKVRGPMRDIYGKAIISDLFGCYFTYKFEEKKIVLKYGGKCHTVADSYCGRLLCTSDLASSLHTSPHAHWTLKKDTSRCQAVTDNAAVYRMDAGIVASGTSCAGGMCYLGACTPVAAVINRTKPKSVCHNGGRVNCHGNCHCPVGYAPPDCSRPGPGGSVDSGPLTEGTGQDTDTRDASAVLMVSLLAVVLLLMSTAAVLAVKFREPLRHKLPDCSASLRVPAFAKYRAGRREWPKPGRPASANSNANFNANSNAAEVHDRSERRLVGHGVRSGQTLQIDKPQLVSSTYTDSLIDRDTVSPQVRPPNMQTLLPSHQSSTTSPRPPITSPRPSTTTPDTSTMSPRPSITSSQRPSITSPKPSTTTPDASITSPRPSITSPRPSITSPKPSTTTPDASTTSPKPSTTSPRPSITSPRPSITSPRPSITSPKPSTTTPDASTTSPRPLITSPRPSIGSPRPSMTSPEPSATSTRPSITSPKPSIMSPKPSITSPKSSTTSPQTSTTSPRPSNSLLRPLTTLPAPSATSPKPTTTSPRPPTTSPKQRPTISSPKPLAASAHGRSLSQQPRPAPKPKPKVSPAQLAGYHQPSA